MISLAMMYSELSDVGVPITAVHNAKGMSAGGLEIDSRYLVDISTVEEKPLLLSFINDDGSLTEGSSFDDVGQLIQFIMEY